MRVGILTFHDALNYGAVLQAYALKTELNKRCDCEIINYYNEYFHLKHKKLNIKYLVANLLYGYQWKQRAKKFEQFCAEYLCSDGKVVDNELSELNSRYDAFVTGSDQVWNLSCSGGSRAYFLNFVDKEKKKYSYAASFGNETPCLEQSDIQLIKSFDLISVRERSAVDYLNRIICKDIREVVDPTFLLTEEQYIENFNLKKSLNSKRYVLIYEVLNGQSIETFAKQIAREHNFEVVCISQSNKIRHGMEVVRNAGPIDWLNLFYNAEYVVTNSFHGLAFSLIFHKQFFIELLPPPATTNARIVELLQSIGLSNRIINIKNYNEVDVNYSEIDLILSKKRNESTEFLEEIVGGIKS